MEKDFTIMLMVIHMRDNFVRIKLLVKVLIVLKLLIKLIQAHG